MASIPLDPWFAGELAAINLIIMLWSENVSSSLLLLPQPIDVSSVEGVMEGVPHDAFSGWTWDTRDPAIELSVEVIAPGFYARIRANEHRSDLAAAGKREGDCWFKMIVPGEVSNHAQVAAFALLAGTSHRLRKVREDDLKLDRNWLDHQPMPMQVAVNAQRVRSGLGRPPLSETQIDELVNSAVERGLDLAELVAATARFD